MGGRTRGRERGIEIGYVDSSRVGLMRKRTTQEEEEEQQEEVLVSYILMIFQIIWMGDMRGASG